MSVGPRSEKFDIVSNYHGRMQKCDFCVSVGKTNFTDHPVLEQKLGLIVLGVTHISNLPTVCVKLIGGCV